MSKKILTGYWFEWNPQLELNEIPMEYNIVCVAFLSEINDGIPIYKPLSHSEDYIIDGIRQLKSEGRDVLISLGGGNSHVALKRNDIRKFVCGMIHIIDKYGFTGVDIDLEGTAIEAEDNVNSIPAALREIKDYYRSMRKRLLITMAPEFPYLRGADAAYRPYIEKLKGYYDYIWPQFYNQGATGIRSDEYDMYLSQNDNVHKAEFLYALSHAIVTGTQGFIKIPANKFAIGLPASPEAAINGYVINPEDVRWALNRLADERHDICGLMTWSVNQDYVNGFQFAERYAPMIHSKMNAAPFCKRRPL